MGIAVSYKRILVLVFLCFVFFMLGNHILDLTNPDEVFYSQTAKEMIKHKTWLVPYLFDQPQFEKPVFTYWLLRLWFMLFGVSNFGARFFPAAFATLGVIAVYLLALIGYKEEKKAFISALVLASSGLYIGLARTVFTDMIFSVFILLSLLSFFRGYVSTDKKAIGIILFFVFSALAVLTKGPLGLIIPLLTVWLFLGIKRDIRFIFSKHCLRGFLLFLVIALPWYVFMINKFGNNFIQEFLYNDHLRRVLEAEHKTNDTWYFYPFSLPLCMFPWSLYVVASCFYLVKKLKDRGASAIYWFLSSWIAVTFIIFQSAHSKLVSYVFPVLPALAVIAGDFIHHLIISHKRRLMFVFSFICWVIFLAMPIGLVINANRYPEYVPSKIPIYNFIYIYALLLIVMLFFIIKRKFLANIYLSSLILPLILFFAFAMHEDFDAHVSSKKACDYLLANYKVENTILCSKFFVRGVRFFTDKPVAVVNKGGASFFSPHPIAYLDSAVKISEFLAKQPLTYCIVNHSALEDIESVAGDSGFKVERLNLIGDEHIVSVKSH